MLLAAAIRLCGAFFDLPYIYHPDEPFNINIAERMYATGNLRPAAFDYPGLFYYLNLAAAHSYLGVLRFFGGHADAVQPIDAQVMGSAFAPSVQLTVLFRWVTVVFGVLTVAGTFIAGRVARDERAGLIAAVLIAVCPLAVGQSRFVTPDIFVTAFGVFALAGACGIATKGSWKTYFLTAACLAAATACKPNGILLATCLPVACALDPSRVSRKLARCLAAAVFGLLVFFVATPYTVLEVSAALRRFSEQLSSYGSGGHAGMDAGGPFWYARELWTQMTLAFPLAVIQMIRSVRSRRAPEIVVTATTLVYLLIVSLFAVKNGRSALPVVPALCILAACATVDIVNWIRNSSESTVGQQLKTIAPPFIALCLVTSPLLADVRQIVSIRTVDSRTTSREWIERNIPPRSTIAVESYSPYLDGNAFHLVRLERAIDQPPAWYVANGVEYVVLSEGMYRRYLEHADQYPWEAAAYRRLAASFVEKKHFVDGGYSVYLYKVEPPPG